MKKLLSLAILACLLVACSSAPEGEKVKANDAKEVNNNVSSEAKELQVDVANSLVNWVGTKTGGQHEGTLNVKSGSVKVEGDKLVGGSFMLDMNSIVVTDLEGKNKTDLENHLKNDDFFEVNKFPEGSFEITNVTEEAGENQTHKIEGNLTLRNISKSVNIPAKVEIAEGSLKASTPQFTINRQEWGIDYESAMKEVILNDEIGIKITLAAK